MKFQLTWAVTFIGYFELASVNGLRILERIGRLVNPIIHGKVRIH